MPRAQRCTRCMGCQKWVWVHEEFVTVGFYDYHPACAPQNTPSDAQKRH